MGTVGSALSVSLDGFATGPDDTPEQGLGRGGEALHAWYGLPQPDDEDTPAEGHTGHGATDAAMDALGAMVCGRVGYDNAGGWGEDPPFRCPIFVLTRTPRAPVVKGETTFHFVTDGFDAAMARAREAAGNRPIGVHGPGPVGQAVDAGVLDELRVDLVPVFLGGGKRLFADITRLDAGVEVTEVKAGNGVTHLTYRFTR